MPTLLTVFAHPTHEDPTLWLIAEVDPDEPEDWTLGPDETFDGVEPLLAALDQAPAITCVVLDVEPATEARLAAAFAARQIQCAVYR